MQCEIRHKGRSESVTFDILEEQGTPLFSVDFGKPQLQLYKNGGLQPRHIDTRSGLENYSITAQLVGETAYSDAILLADLIKSRTGPTEELIINVSGSNLPDVYPTQDTIVAPAAEQNRALELTYSPGRVNVVDVQLSLTRVFDVLGSANQDASTPTATGNETLQLSDGTDTVNLEQDIAVTRTVGRPNSTIRATTQGNPTYIDQRKSAFDAIDIALEFANVESSATTLRDIVAQQLGRDSLTLDFQGLYNMGEFDVVPSGSQALRIQRLAGQVDVDNAPTLNLRRVKNV
jgi:hypothetical protein